LTVQGIGLANLPSPILTVGQFRETLADKVKFPPTIGRNYQTAGVKEF